MNDVTVDKIKAIKPIKPITTSWPRRLLEMLPEIESKLAEEGVTQKMVADTFGLKQSEFSVYLGRAKALRDKINLKKIEKQIITK
jgi:hypothetical protein